MTLLLRIIIIVVLFLASQSQKGTIGLKMKIDAPTMVFVYFVVFLGKVNLGSALLRLEKDQLAARFISLTR